MPCIAKVAVNDATIHFDKLYSYLVPPDFSESLWPGSIVLVPFGRGNHPRMAVVLEVGTEEAPDPRLKSLLAAAPEKARLTPDLLELVHFLKDRYFCTWYEAVKAVIPYGAQYQPGMENGKPVLKSRLTRTLKPFMPWLASCRRNQNPAHARFRPWKRCAQGLAPNPLWKRRDIFLHFKRVMPERHSENRTTG